MNNYESQPSKDATLFVLKAFSIREQFRITSRLVSILRCTVPSPSTRWYDYCMLMWPHDLSLGRMDRYVTFGDIQQRLRDEEPLRRILLGKGFYLAPRWRRRLMPLLEQLVYFNATHRDWLQNIEWP